MKTLPSTVSAEIVKTALIPVHLYALELLTTDTVLNTKVVRLAASDKDVHFDDNLYTAFPISHESIRTSTEMAVDATRVLVGVVDSTIIGLLFRHDGLRRAKVTILTVFDGLLDDPDNKIISFEGYVSHAAISEQVASIEVTSKFDVQDIRLPRRVYLRDRCAWIYKDSNTCQYTGPLPTCDKSLDGNNGCRAHSNTARFGGFPAIPSKKGIVT